MGHPAPIVQSRILAHTHVNRLPHTTDTQVNRSPRVRKRQPAHPRRGRERVNRPVSLSGQVNVQDSRPVNRLVLFFLFLSQNTVSGQPVRPLALHHAVTSTSPLVSVEPRHPSPVRCRVNRSTTRPQPATPTTPKSRLGQPARLRHRTRRRRRTHSCAPAARRPDSHPRPSLRPLPSRLTAEAVVDDRG